MRTLTPEQSDRLNAAMAKTLSIGSHWRGDRSDITRCEVCARELAHWVMTGTALDETPDGASVLLSALPPLNDGQWRDDNHRTSVILPYLPRLLTLDPADDEPKAYALADYAVRVCAAEAMDAAGLHDTAAKLRELEPITNKVTATDAAEEADSAYTFAEYVVSLATNYVGINAASAACSAADAAEYVASRSADYAGAAESTAGSAGACVRALTLAGYCANSGAEAFERHARAILDIICGLNAMEE